MTLTQEQIDRFRAWHEGAWRDAEWAESARRRMQRRETVAPEILDLFSQFAADRISLIEFKTTFDLKTRKEWDVFGLKAMSGAMFLNTLTNHLPPDAGVGDRLKATLLAPATEREGRERMSAFYDYLNQTLAERHIPLRKIQPRRVPFFVSAWWYLQNPELWPACYESVRRVFAEEGLLEESGGVVEDYFALRSKWLELRERLGISSWELDLLCSRVAKSTVASVEPVSEVSDVVVVETVDEPATDSAHTEVQGLLAQLGHKLGCKVWIAANDQNRQWKGEKLGTLSLSSLPNLGMGEDAQKIINLIDVIWLKGGKQVVAAFEVESTTSIFSGLLRMSDLVATCPNLNIFCFIVVPESRKSLVIRQLSRPTFQALDLNSRCGFFTIESLKDEIPSMVKWAKDPASVKDLATFVQGSE